MSDSLRDRVIRLAHANPALRKPLLDVLASSVREAAVVDPELDRLIEAFRRQIQSTLDAHYAKSFPTLEVPQIKLEWGQKYVRIVRERGPNDRSAFGFIDTTNGDLLKAESWKKPARIPRGNLYDASTWKGSHDPYGMAYLR